MTKELPDTRMWQWTNDRPDTSPWVERIGRLRGEFGRPAGMRVAAQAMMLIWILATGGMVLFLMHLMDKVRAPPAMGIFLGGFALAFAIWVTTIWRRVGLKYLLRDGTLTALGTYGNVMWTERLENLQAIRYSSFRGSARLTLVWPDRQREMLGIPSLLNALDEPDGSNPAATATPGVRS